MLHVWLCAKSRSRRSCNLLIQSMFCLHAAISNHTRPLAFAVGDSTFSSFVWLAMKNGCCLSPPVGLILKGGFQAILQTHNESHRPKSRFTEPILIVEPVRKNKRSSNVQWLCHAMLNSQDKCCKLRPCLCMFELDNPKVQCGEAPPAKYCKSMV